MDPTTDIVNRFLAGEIDARAAARELAAIPTEIEDNHHYLTSRRDLPPEFIRAKFAELNAALNDVALPSAPVTGPWCNFSDQVRLALANTSHIAAASRAAEVQPIHLLRGIIDAPNVASLLAGCCDLHRLRKTLDRKLGINGSPVPPSATELPYSRAAQAVLEYAMNEATQGSGHTEQGGIELHTVDAPHLVLGLLRLRTRPRLFSWLPHRKDPVQRLLHRAGVEYQVLHAALQRAAQS
jgi:hypothetical protein